ncbi:MAG: primase C-terminal domain-containing protein [Candidatus Thiodiazotropha sp. (ex Ctena orbiculata)]|nr:primase C-terminal domain-containing protein [Candidatus Thiodiazotropha taylori]MBT3034560.1 primase C-terminal domain-containing protein [Candidatus Thiodiazotropha taylori]
MSDLFKNIPPELQQLDQWLCWRSENGAKVPKVANGRCKRNASSTNPKTWSSFDEAVYCAKNNQGFGIGFVFTADDPFIGIDLDNKDDDQELDKDHRFWIDRLDSYTERSPSGKGYHIIVRGDQITGFNSSPFEAYSSGRYFTFTGDVVLDRAVNGNKSAKSDFFKIFGESDHSKFEMPESIEVGNRNDTMFRLACSMLSKGIDQDEVSLIISGFNRGLENPFPSKEVHALLTSAAGYEYDDHKQHVTTGENTPLHTLMNFSATHRISEMKNNLSNDYYIIPEMALGGQITLFYAKPNAGKTLLFFNFIIKGIENGTLNPNNIFYINADDNYKGLYTKTQIAKKHKFNIISPAEAGISPNNIIQLLDELAESDDAVGKIIFLDTLKKFADMMDKRSQADLYSVLRRLVARNASVIIAGHANKHADADGNLVYEGTADTFNDVDAVYSIYCISDREDPKQVIEFRREKDRGDVIPKVSYSYQKKRGMSYEDLINSVHRLDETEYKKVTQIKDQKNRRSQYRYEIDFVSELLKNGPMNQSAILKAFNKLNLRKRVFSRNSLRAALLELTDIEWTVKRGDKNAAIYTLVDL